MSKMKRISFLKMGTLAMLTPLANSFFVQAVLNTEKKCLVADDIMKELIAANDAKVGQLLASLEPGNLKFSRRTGYDIAILSASYCSGSSKYYHDPLIVSRLELLIRFLAASQSADGTVNIANLESPPDTAFLMEILCAVAHILLKDNSKELSAINNDLEKIIVKAGDALSKGGVHTPNHRWVICAALAQINALYPDKKYRDRIEDWLGEGIFIDQDGHYPERSGNYAAVENTAFITVARLLNKPSLLQPVRKNLEMMYYYMEPDGELVSADSRRQDQYAPVNIALFYLQYRYIAIRDNDSHFAAIVKQIESLKGFREAVLDRSLFLFMENSLLQKELPAPGHLSVNYEKLLTSSHLLRIRRNNITTTLFGGVDWPLIIASGRSNSPNFFSYRKGNAVLKYMRLSSGFFSTGYFYSDGLR